jgi:hypothetical protein
MCRVRLAHDETLKRGAESDVIDNLVRDDIEQRIPEKFRGYWRLHIGILCRAILDAIGQMPDPPEVRNRIRSKAGQYVFSASLEKGGFLWICEQLDADPYRIRRFVRDYRDDESDGARKLMFMSYESALRRFLD